MLSEAFTSDSMGDASVDKSSMATYACFAFASLTGDASVDEIRMKMHFAPCSMPASMISRCLYDLSGGDAGVCDARILQATLLCTPYVGTGHVTEPRRALVS